MGEPGWQCCGVFCIERRDPGEITLVEEINPFGIHRLNLGLLSEHRYNYPGHEEQSPMRSCA